MDGQAVGCKVLILKKSGTLAGHKGEESPGEFDRELIYLVIDLGS